MKNYRKIIVSLVIFFFFMILATGSSIGGEEEKAEKVFEPMPVPEESSTVTEEELIDSTEAGQIDDEITGDLDIEEFELQVAARLQESFGEDAEVEFVKAEKTYYITPNDPVFMDELIDALDGEAYAIEGWESFTAAMVELSVVLQEALPGYWLEVRNPENPDLSLLMITDGEVVYDVLKDEDM